MKMNTRAKPQRVKGNVSSSIKLVKLGMQLWITKNLSSYTALLNMSFRS